MGGALAHLAKDPRRRRAGLPVGEFQQQDADHVVVDPLALKRDAAAGIDRIDPRDRQDLPLDLLDQQIGIDRREVAAGMDLDLRDVGLDFRKELDPMAVGAVGHRGPHGDGQGADQHQQRMPQQPVQQPDVATGQAAQSRKVAALAAAALDRA